MSGKAKTVREPCVTKGNSGADGSAMALYNFARQYHEAADRLFDQHRQLRVPVYFLYFHTIELALKAYLRSHNISIKKIHHLPQLHEECKKRGLVVGPDDRIGIENIVNLLESANEEQGLRYFSMKSGSTADLAWTHDVVGQLMGVLKTHLKVPEHQMPGPPVRFVMTFGRPGGMEVE